MLCIVAGSSAYAASSDADRLQQLIDSPHRTAANKARDRYRNPLPTLTFLELTPRAQVIEIQPGTAGYWTEILAPYLKNEGRYTATVPKANPDRPEAMKAIADTKEIGRAHV